MRSRGDHRSRPDHRHRHARRGWSRGIVPERTVELATDDPSADERFRADPARGCRRRAQDGRVTIRGRGDDFVTDVIQCLSEHRIRVTDFRTVLPTLEDVFLDASPATRFATED